MDEDAETYAARLSLRFAWDVERWEGGQHGYDATLAVGPLRVYHHPGRPEMGVCVEVKGTACEEIGPAGAGWLLLEPGWKQTRVDLAVDGGDFTPEMMRDAVWADNVRTVARYVKGAKAGREAWRSGGWDARADGDMFTLGSRQSGQFLRCYDRREFTRVELELKGRAAQAAAAMIGAVLVEGDGGAFGEVAVGLVRRFVDLVDRSQDANVSRAPLLPFWAAFVGEAPKAVLWLGERVVKSAAEMLDWALHQTAPVLAVLERVFGPAILRDLAAEGRGRWKRRHRETLRLAGIGAGA